MIVFPRTDYPTAAAFGDNMKIIKIEDFVKNYKENAGVMGDGKLLFNGECIALTGKTRGEITIKLHISDETAVGVTHGNVKAYQEVSEQHGLKLAEVRSALVGYVLKRYGLCETDTVAANVIFPVYFSNKFKPKSYKPRCLQVLEMCGIADLANEKIFTLNDSERFRTSVVRALINDPDIIIFDEQSLKGEELDYEAVAEIFVMLNNLNKIILLIPENVDVSAYLEQKIVMAIDNN